MEGSHSPHPGTMTTTQRQTNHAEDNATSYGKTIEALYELSCWDFSTGEAPQALTGAAADLLSDLDWDAETETLQEAITEYVSEMPLEVLVRSGWHELGETFEVAEFEITLSTGGPGCRIYGELYRGSVESATVEHQDWFKPWTASSYDVNTDALVWFCEQFYFGD